MAASRNLVAAVAFTLLNVVIAASSQAVGSLGGLSTILTTGVIPAVEFMGPLKRVCAKKLVVNESAKAAV